ncbi:hypothetical protein CRG98_026404 [Punica granatum]|nr:hypothetical protein CRG98_026404 [Punica granatum]
MEKLEKKSLEELDQMVYQEMMKALQFGRSQSQALASLRNKAGRLSQDLVLASENKERVQRHLLEECKSRRREREELQKSTLELEAEKDCFIRETRALRDQNRLLQAELRAKELGVKRLPESNLNIEEELIRGLDSRRMLTSEQSGG